MLPNDINFIYLHFNEYKIKHVVCRTYSKCKCIIVLACMYIYKHLKTKNDNLILWRIQTMYQYII